MTDVQWFFIRSWHVYKKTNSTGYKIAVCGRASHGTFDSVVEDRPGDERTCESCLRIIGPK